MKNKREKADITDYLENVLHLNQTSAQDFYRSIFPSGELERHHDNPDDYEKGKYTGIIVEVTNELKDDGKPKVLRHTVTDDLSKISEVTKRSNFCLMSPISYAGKSRDSRNARFIYAMAVDVDGVMYKDNLDILFKQINKNEFFADGGVYWGIPKPTYIVSSGTGMHFYYVFDRPIPLFPNIVKELEKLKRRITWQIWTQGGTELQDSIQYESLFQGFRMVGTITKKGNRTVAYEYGDKVTLSYLNYSVPDDWRADFKQRISKVNLETAKKKWPDWYEKRITKKTPKGTWICKTDLYNWWLRRIREVQQGHRYWSVMTLAIYAKKCAIPYEKLVSDAIDLIPFLDSMGKNDPFTESDVMKAVEAYNDSYMTYPIDTIVRRTDIAIQKNKRNGRRQSLHLKLARANRDILCAEQGKENWWEGNGRPKGSQNKEYKKKEIVKSWRMNHPEGKKIECHRETGLSRMTIDKWWNAIDEV